MSRIAPHSEEIAGRLEVMRNELQTRLIEKTNEDWYVEIWYYGQLDVSFRALCRDYSASTLCLDIRESIDIPESQIQYLILDFLAWKESPQEYRDKINAIRASVRNRTVYDTESSHPS